jgi:hypothetical protein
MKTMKIKGQSDTFKLLIAAVVAMAILTIVASILGLINPGAIGCVTNPLDDIASNIKKAQSGLTASTGTICLKSGEGFTDVSLKTRVSGLRTAEFECMSGASICTPPGNPLSIQNNGIQALSTDVQFVTIISCTKTSDNTGDYDCTLSVKSKT